MLTLLGDALAGGAALDTAGDQAEPVVVRALWEGSIPAFGYIGLIIMALFILLLSMEQGYFETLRQGSRYSRCLLHSSYTTSISNNVTLGGNIPEEVSLSSFNASPN
jgi:hypothetical protein